MGRRTISEENIRILQKSKGSYYITLPIEYVRMLGWKDGQKVRVKKDGAKLIIEDWRP